IELRLDSADGEVIGTLPIGFTGGWDNWVTKTTSISGVTGVHDLYMIFKGNPSEELFKFDYWKFEEKKDEHELVAINATIDRQKIDVDPKNNTANITVTAIYADGTSEDVTAQAEAVPEQEGIVNIKDGIVTGIGFGKTKINISYGGKTDSVYLEVKDLEAELTVKKITVDKNKVEMDPGGTASFKVTAEYYDGHTEDVTNKVTYYNLRPNVAEVSNGTITAKASGATTVVMSFKGELGDAVTTSMYITVSNLSAPMKFVIRTCNPVFEGPARVVYGDVIGYLDRGTDGGPDGAVTFTINVPNSGRYKMSVYNVVYGGASHKYVINGDTSNTIIYTYPSEPSGWKLSPFSQDINLNAGNNTIRISFNSGAAEVQYIELQYYSSDGTYTPITELSLNKSSVSLAKGEVDTLVATAGPADATDKEAIFVVEGSAVSLGEPVYNENDGTTSVQIKAEQPGTAVVKAYAGGFESSCIVTVTEPAEEGEYTIISEFDTDRLKANEMVNAVVTAKNNKSSITEVLVIVALYEDEKMINLSFISKEIPIGSSEKMWAGFKTPSTITDKHKVRVFVWDGKTVESSNGIPLSSVKELLP
ncbi:MAG: carbohydrate-binding protein, partial [Clostridiaceae bacterium]|nr:carbohydrate-binding protein [Clostridiaceae bacterium]